MLNNTRPFRSLRGPLCTALVIALLVSGLGPIVGEPVSARRSRLAEPAETLTNAATITIPDNGQSAPSTILVRGQGAEVADVNVTLHSLNHERVSDLDLLLVGPDGQTAIVLSDVGSSANDETLTLDDQATERLSASGPLRRGTFQPINRESGDGFLPPAPASPGSGARLSAFNSTNPNGEWTLHIRDDASGVAGAVLGGWSLHITTSPGVPNAAPDSVRAKAGKPLKADVLKNDRDPEGETLTVSLADPPTRGQVHLQPDGSFTYRAGKKARGQDSFTYLVRDPGGLSDLETVDITIKKAKKKKRKR